MSDKPCKKCGGKDRYDNGRCRPLEVKIVLKAIDIGRICHKIGEY
jgi:hypothetical protein